MGTPGLLLHCTAGKLSIRGHPKQLPEDGVGLLEHKDDQPVEDNHAGGAQAGVHLRLSVAIVAGDPERLQPYNCCDLLLLGHHNACAVCMGEEMRGEGKQIGDVPHLHELSHGTQGCVLLCLQAPLAQDLCADLLRACNGIIPHDL